MSPWATNLSEQHLLTYDHETKKFYFKQYTCSCKLCIKGKFSRCSSGVKVLDSVLSNPVLNSQQNESIVTLDEPSYTVAYRKVKMSEVSFSKSNDNTLGFRENELVVNMTQQEFSVINEELSEDSEFRSGKPYTGASIDKILQMTNNSNSDTTVFTSDQCQKILDLKVEESR